MIDYKDAKKLMTLSYEEKYDELSKLSIKDQQDFENFFIGPSSHIEKKKKVKFSELWQLDQCSLLRLFEKKDKLFNEHTSSLEYMIELKYLAFFRDIMSYELYFLFISQFGFSGLKDYADFVKKLYGEDLINEIDETKRDEMVFNAYDQFKEKEKEDYWQL